MHGGSSLLGSKDRVPSSATLFLQQHELFRPAGNRFVGSTNQSGSRRKCKRRDRRAPHLAREWKSFCAEGIRRQFQNGCQEVARLLNEELGQGDQQ